MPAVNGCTCKVLSRVDIVDAIVSELHCPPVTLMILCLIAECYILIIGNYQQFRSVQISKADLLPGLARHDAR